MSIKLNLLTFLFAAGLLISCGEKKSEDQQLSLGDYSSTETQTETGAAETETATESSPLLNKGIGPVTELSLGELDQAHAAQGKVIFESMCTACHKWEKKFVGPALTGVTERRSPEWIMNMILNPEEMIAKDPIAKKLLVENNMAMMANQNLKEEDARAVLEYFRSLDMETAGK